MKDYDEADSHSVLMIGFMDTILHQIRLRGPWDVVSPQGSLMTLTVPFAWRDVFKDEAGTIRCTRKFNCPTGLEPSNRVLIRLPEGCGKVREFQVNQAVVAPENSQGFDFDITSELKDFNEIVALIEFAPNGSPHEPGGLWTPVLIQILE